MYIWDKVFTALRKWTWTPTDVKGRNKLVCIIKIGVACSVAHIIGHEFIVVPDLETVKSETRGKVGILINIYENKEQFLNTVWEKINQFPLESLKDIPSKVWEDFWERSFFDKLAIYTEVSAFWNSLALSNNLWAWRNRSFSAIIRRMLKDDNFKRKFLASKKYFRKKRILERQEQGDTSDKND